LTRRPGSDGALRHPIERGRLGLCCAIGARGPISLAFGTGGAEVTRRKAEVCETEVCETEVCRL
jgi:hypothetical protein